MAIAKTAYIVLRSNADLVMQKLKAYKHRAFWALLLLLLFSDCDVAAFVPGNKVKLPRNQRYDEILWLKMGGDNAGIDDDDDDDDNDDEDSAISYKRRSLAWTRRYRKLIPYEKARLRAMSLGLRSVDEWDDFLQDGKVYQHGPYLPTQPDLMYPDDWVSWEEFLGIMRPYDDAKKVVQMIGLKNETQYREFIAADAKRAEGLRIPAKPEIVYKNRGWISYEDFLENSEQHQEKAS